MRNTIGLLFILAVMALSGCAHAWVEQWDGDKLQVCGNRWASAQDAFEEAQNHCEGTPKAVGMTYKEIGVTVTGGYGGYNVNGNRYQCLVYQCQSVRRPAGN